MRKNTFTYSRLSTQSVTELLIENSHCSTQANCQFLLSGLHDNYLVNDKGRRFIFRIYRSSWRTLTEIIYECDFLHYLSQQEQRVSIPVSNIFGSDTIQIETAEGPRYGTLFTFAEGKAPNVDLTTKDARILGKCVATLHHTSGSFTPGSSKKALTADELLHHSIESICQYTQHPITQYLQQRESILARTFDCFQKSKLTYGVCHGDINPSNFHITDSGKLTLFDFDQCGEGFFVFDIAKFFSSIHHFANKAELAHAFLYGYQQKKLLTLDEVVSLPQLQQIAIIWVMSIHVSNADFIGHGRLNSSYWDRNIHLLNELENENLELEL